MAADNRFSDAADLWFQIAVGCFARQRDRLASDPHQRTDAAATVLPHRDMGGRQRQIAHAFNKNSLLIGQLQLYLLVLFAVS